MFEPPNAAPDEAGAAAPGAPNNEVGCAGLLPCPRFEKSEGAVVEVAGGFVPPPKSDVDEL